jgi:antiviral helicase SLH1
MVVIPRLDNARALVHQLRGILDTQVGMANRPQDMDPARNRVWVITTRCLLELLERDRNGPLLQGLRLVICEDLGLLDSTYEMALSLLLLSVQTRPVRIIGLAAALHDTVTLSDWLNVPIEGVYCFPPTERDQALSITFQTFNIPYSAALMKAMVKPVYDSLRSVPVGESAIVFVPSIGQCNMIVAELVTQCAVGMNMKGFLGEDVSTETLEVYANNLKNRGLADGVMRGIATWHDRMDQGDKMLMLRLFVEGVIRVLVIPRELCWNAPVRASLVIAMSTQYAAGSISHVDNKRAERHVMEYSLHELIRMQGRAVRHGKTGHFHILCQAEHRDAYMRFLTDGIPLESQLLGEEGGNAMGDEILKDWVRAQRQLGSMKTPQDVMEFLSSTFLARRIAHNPSYYDAEGDRTTYLSRLVDGLWDRGSIRSEA